MNARCDNILARLDEWLDDELSPVDRADIAAHLSECTNCRRNFERFVEIDEKLNRLSASAERIARSSRRNQLRPFVTLFRIAAAIAILVVVGLAYRAMLARPGPPARMAAMPTAVAQADVASTVIASTPTLAVSLPTRNPRVSIVMLYEPTRLPAESPPASKPSI